jgi:hypothetical protein
MMEGVEAGDGFACGFLAQGLPGASGATRRQLLQIAELGIGREDLLSIIAVAKDLALRGRRKEAARLLRKLEHMAPRVRCMASDWEFEARCAAGMKRAARRVCRLGAYYGANFLDESPKCRDELIRSDPDLGRVYVLMRLEGFQMR